jgi:integrase
VQIPLFECAAEGETTSGEPKTEMQTTADWIDLPFEQACKGWLETRRDHIGEKSFHEYGLNIKTLNKFFHKYKLEETANPNLFEAYQRWRIQQCGAPAINHELGVLQQVLRRIGLWDKVEKFYQPLPLSKRKRGVAIEDHEREQLWRIMHSSHDWDALRYYLTIMINSTASPSETQRLKLQDIHRKERYFEVGNNGAKNEDRIRHLRFNDESEDAFREAIGRAKLLGAYEPWHYLFPKRVSGNNYDPLKHQTTFRTAWDKVKQEAIRQGMKVARLRMEDMRHTAGTKLWKNRQVSEETARTIMGHGSNQMKKFYSHIRVDAQQEAIDALASPSYRRQQMAVVPIAQPQPAPEAQPNGNRALAEQLLALAAKLLNSQ